LLPDPVPSDPAISLASKTKYLPEGTEDITKLIAKEILFVMMDMNYVIEGIEATNVISSKV
jgi:hypothetical protein